MAVGASRRQGRAKLAQLDTELAMNEVVQRLVKKHGLEMTVHSGSRESRVFDFSLTTADGDHIGIECNRTLGLRSDRDVTRFLNRVNEAFGPAMLGRLFSSRTGSRSKCETHWMPTMESSS